MRDGQDLLMVSAGITIDAMKRVERRSPRKGASLRNDVTSAQGEKWQRSGLSAKAQIKSVPS